MTEPTTDTPDTLPMDEAPEPPKRRRGRPRKDATAPAAEAPARKPRPSDKRPRSHSRRPPLAPRVEALHVVGGAAMKFAPSPVAKAAGDALGEHAANIGAAWENYAKANPRVREALERFLGYTELTPLLLAYAPVIVAGISATPDGAAKLGAVAGMAAGVGSPVVADVPAAADATPEAPAA